MRKFIQATFAGVLILITSAAILCWDPLIQANAKTLLVPEDRYAVEIIRDRWGVPHIFGKTDADTAFGLAYAHAEDDFITIQEMVAATRGDLARYRGKPAATTDYIVNLIGVWDTIDRRYEKDVPDQLKAIVNAYADGLNQYAATHPKENWAGVAPFTGRDIIAGFVFKTPFFYGFDGTLLELFDDSKSREIALAPDAQKHSWHIQGRGLIKRGSNGFAVSGARSGDGVTRLVINSHQPLTGPVAWYEAHLVSQEGLDMSGGLFPGTPFILHGFNDDIGWANTVNAPDLADVYVLKINPKNKDQYLLDGKWRDFDITTAKLRIKLFGPFALKLNRKVYRSAHGPVIRRKNKAYAVRYAGHGEIRQLEQYYRLNHAHSLADFTAAMSMNALPSINYIYADKAGNIGFVHNGQYPDRMPGWDWQKYLPGDRSDLIWQHYLPYKDVPKLFNPSSGFVYNSNNTPFSATDGPDNLRAQDFPKTMGLQINQTNRSLRVQELTDGKSPIDRDRLLRIKFDTAYAKGSRTFEIINRLLAKDWSSDPHMAKAAKILAAWDGTTGIHNRQAALAVLSTLDDITAEFTHKPVPPAEESFKTAVNYLSEHYGRLDPEWGELNRIVRGNVNLPIDGAPDVIRAVYPENIRADGQLHDAAGDSFIALVEWDKDGKLNAHLVNNYGAAVSHPESPHYADQLLLFAAHKWRKALRNEKEVRLTAASIYTPWQK